MASHKGQHYVSKAYLSAWTDPSTPTGREPYVWIFSRDGSTAGRPKAPSNIFKETDMYTVHLPNGERDLHFEHGLSQLETGVTRTRTDLLERRKQPPAVPYLKLAAFVAAAHSRTPRFRDHQRRQWQQVLDAAAEMKASMEKKTPKERARVAEMFVKSDRQSSMSIEEVQHIVDYPIQTIAPAAMHAELMFLPHMVWRVLCAPAGCSFITTDSPVAWFDPESHKKPPLYRGPALMDETLEITMPISPRQLLMMTHARPISKGRKPIRYVDVPEWVVAELNRRALAHADKEVVVDRNSFDPRWRSSMPITNNDDE